MKSSLSLLLGVVIAVILLAFMFMFQVRYDEVAVVATFGAAGADTVRQPRPWPYLRLPPPIQQVHRYSTRLRLLEDVPQEQKIKDESAVVVQAYIVWRIARPYEFYKSCQTEANAEAKLRPLLSDLRSEISQYRLDQLVNTDPAQVQLTAIEEAARKRLNAQVSQANNDLGVEIQRVGIRRLVFAEQVTPKVFDRMKQTQQTRASRITQDAEAKATESKSQAESWRRIILAFADSRAQAIRAQGDMEAAEFYKAFKDDQQLAAFLRTVDTFKKILPNHTTFVLSADQLGLDQFLMSGQALKPKTESPR